MISWPEIDSFLSLKRINPTLDFVKICLLIPISNNFVLLIFYFWWAVVCEKKNIAGLQNHGFFRYRGFSSPPGTHEFLINYNKLNFLLTYFVIGICIYNLIWSKEDIIAAISMITSGYFYWLNLGFVQFFSLNSLIRFVI